jgi:5'-3' exonuclease
MILVDYSGIAIAGILSQVKNNKIEESFIRHLILNSLRMYNVKYRDKYGPLVVACDGGSWRKTVFSQYKASRKKNRDSSSLDWPEIFRIINKVRDEIVEFLPYKVVQLAGAEADDVIATLAKLTQEFGMYEPVMIVSADKDFIQLQKYDNISQFSPMTKKVVSDPNPRKYLFEHIVRGDAGDGVPNILSADNTLVEGIRQNAVSAKKVLEWYTYFVNGNLEKVLPPEVLTNYKRNQTVIDLDHIPQNITDSIIEVYNNCSDTGNSKVLNYLISNRCNMLISCAGEFFEKK